MRNSLYLKAMGLHYWQLRAFEPPANNRLKGYLLKHREGVCLEVWLLREELHQPSLASLLDKILASIEYNSFKFIDLDHYSNIKHDLLTSGCRLFLGEDAWRNHLLSQNTHLEAGCLVATGEHFSALSHSLRELSENLSFKRALWQLIKQIQARLNISK